MTMECQPLRSFPPSDSEEGGEPDKGVEEETKVVFEGKKNMVKEGSSSIKLCLGNGEENFLIKFGNPVLTPTQLIEFQQQTLIFKHMKAGLPVPLHLVIPVWKSVASCFGSENGGIYKQYPSFVGFSLKEFDYRKMMDPEPGRCRRTDGKKWRCSRDVVPDQKYCERHMHRGRQRSRKLVEASQIASPSGTTSESENVKNISTHSQIDPHPQSVLSSPLIPPSNSKNSKAVSALLQLTTTSSSNIDNVITTTTSSKDDNKNNVLFSGVNNSKNVIGGSIDSATTIAFTVNTTLDTAKSIPRLSTVTTNNGGNTVNSSKISATTIPITTDTAAATTPIPTIDPTTGTSITTANSTTSSNNNINNLSIGWNCHGSNCPSIKSMINRSSRSGNKHSSYVSAGLGFSPKSVLQVLGYSGSCFYRSYMEVEPGRCRRTDGKKWRCSRNVVPDQKYCGRHMHRGAKKRVEASQSVANFTTIASTVSLPRTIMVSNDKDYATLNTNLSISIPTNPQLVTNDGKSPTSSSDATISDTTITAYESGNFCS